MMEPVRILFHNSYPGVGGSQKMAWQLLDGMPQDHYETWAAAPFDTEFLAGCGLPPARRLDLRIPMAFRSRRGVLLRRNPVRLFGETLWSLVPFWWRTWRTFRTCGFRLLYVSNERCLFFAGIPARLAGIPVVWHIQSGFRMGRPRVHWLASRIATHAVAVSEAVRQDAGRFIHSKLFTHTRLIYNGLPDTMRNSGAMRQEKSSLFQLTFIGALTPEKGLHVLLGALQGWSEPGKEKWRLNVAGEFRDAWYEARIRPFFQAEHVAWLGFCADVPALLDRTDLLVVPSIETEKFELPDGTVHTVRWKEGFGLVALEGLRAGVPVLVADTYGLREVVGDAGLYFAPGDVNDLREKIALLAADEALRRRLGRAGRQRYEELFTREKMQAQFVRFFDAILSE